MDNNDFNKLINLLTLSLIQPTKIEFERCGFFPEENSQIQINWKVLYPSEPFEIEENVLKLFPLFEVELSHNNEVLYIHKSIFCVLLTINDKENFDFLWKNEEIQKFFKEKQIVKTLWPIVRQQVLDGLSRLALPSIPLPWLF